MVAVKTRSCQTKKQMAKGSRKKNLWSRKDSDERRTRENNNGEAKDQCVKRVRE